MLGPGRALVDLGPVHMMVQAWRGGRPHSASAAAGAQKAVSLLKELSRHLATARLPVSHPACRVGKQGPEVLRRMLAAVRMLKEPDFTPMAAVAGAFSDLAKEAALDAGAERVLVNNGGDIALKVEPGGSPFRVGLLSDLDRPQLSGVLYVESGAGVAGVATSGLGGRSLSKGVASAVTCLAATAARADAAATAVANAANVDDPAVERCPAEELDPLTDLKGHTVTKKVGRLSDSAALRALAGGIGRARELCRAGLITGCLIYVQQAVGFWPADLPWEALKAQVPAGARPREASALGMPLA